MALQAEQIHVADLQHVRAGPAVDHVARFAAVHLHRGMFEDKRPLFVRMALEAHRVLRGRRSHLLGPHRSMHVVAIAALDEPFVDAVMEGHREFSLLRQMASVTKFRLRFNQQEFLGLRVMRRMAGDAAHAVLRVHRIKRVHVLLAAGVTRQAACDDFLGGGFLKLEDLGDVTAAGDVRRPGSVTTLAPLMRRAALGIERRLPVRCLLPALVNVFVAGLADFRAEVRVAAGVVLALGARFLRGSGSGGLAGLRGTSCGLPQNGRRHQNENREQLRGRRHLQSQHRFPSLRNRKLWGLGFFRRAFPRKAGSGVEKLVLKSDSLRRPTATAIICAAIIHGNRRLEVLY
jgi:hypothetical protein